MRGNKYLQLAVVSAIALAAGSASTAPLTLTGPITGNTLGPQSASAPCIIAGTNCSQPAGFGYNNFSPNNATNLDRYSNNPGTGNVADGVAGSPYTVSQIVALFPTRMFDVAIDVNTTGAQSETLRFFEVIIGGVQAYVYDPGVPGTSDGTVIGDVNNNGNGYADWLLGTIDLTGYANNVTVLFHAIWTNAVDGAESFFLVASGSSPPIGRVPEPATLALVGLALVGMGAARRGRKT